MHSPAPAYSSAVPQFRLAKQEDASALADLARQTFIETYAEQNDAEQIRTHCDKNFGVAQQSKEIADPNYVVILAYHDEALVGFAQVVNNPAPPSIEAENAVALYRYYVKKEWHGKGIAQPLLAEAEKAAKTFGANQLWLGMWEHNARALAYYQKVGFQHVGWMDYQFGDIIERDYVLLKQL
ncbi:GNAT family N-acetyltransferase [Undibacterium macrobrachii]|jgi:GNAT superfamily N-acetyltransferase|uniref:N-acetyltransferase n=1 Tax=Undibacterium macrobrachii TaxID=1119058 RepID=A0ABQ2XBM9_9BURK|nr:GNAT family N-acetyltransferase [Undibacterium macrobrachii]GGX08838.1 N-acetyltransferase [Undibacterium macrobrachii]